MGDCSYLDARLTIYSDLDWAMGCVDLMSYSGNASVTNGDLVAWFTHKQPVGTVSSTEAEYIAVSDGMQSLVKHLLLP